MPRIESTACCVLAALTVGWPWHAQAACEARSGPGTAALVELYTSEGCSSCPPADQQLGRLRDALDAGAQVVPLSLHVGYWDYIGWKDPYAKPVFNERHEWLVQMNRLKTAYTPHFFVGGAEIRSWQGRLGEAIRLVNARPAQADLHLRAELAQDNALSIATDVRLRSGAEPASLYLALTESALASNVTRGENAGTTLRHNHVVREWIGPIRIAGESTNAQRRVVLPAGWNRAQLSVAAFVQSERNGQVLQALSLLQCAVR